MKATNLIWATAMVLSVAMFSSCSKKEPSPDPLTYDKGVVINGIKWATRNVDAPGTFVAKPEDPGMLYQWNRKQGWPATGEVPDWDNTDAEGDVWEKTNDPCPAGWHVPTHEEQINLARTGSEWTDTPVEGRIFGNGGNTIFLPATGGRTLLGGPLYLTSSGYYWSATPDMDMGALYPLGARLYFSSTDVKFSSINRGYGFSVRCVAE